MYAWWWVFSNRMNFCWIINHDGCIHARTRARYWIVRGLVISGMHTTACGVVENLLDTVETFGFVPNGLRVYYLTRSQPPLLSDMVHTLLRSIRMANGDGDDNDRDMYCGFESRTAFLQRWLPVLDREYAFWMANRSVSLIQQAPAGGVGSDGDANRERQRIVPAASPPNATTTAATKTTTSYRLNLYNASTVSPRPESFAEDVTNAAVAAAAAAGAGKDPKVASEAFFRGVATAAESG